jgi:hypothetical protein
MNKFSRIILFLLTLTLAFSCRFKKDTGSIDMDNWLSDRNGCKGLRIKDLKEIERLKNSFLGADNQALIVTFGRPDRVDLIDKSQTYFTYFLEPSIRCDEAEPKKEPLRVLFRLNSIERVSEVNITTQNP